MAKGIKYQTYLVNDYLKDSERAAGYLKEAILAGELDLLKAVIEDLIEAGYEIFQIGVEKSKLNGETETSINVEMTQKRLEVNQK